jgi:YD repeat-containing protein
VDYAIDFNGEKTDYSYDAQNRLVLKEYLSDRTSVGYSYTPVGLVDRITDSQGITQFWYDERDRLVTRKDPNGVYTSDGYSIEYGYDSAGNRTRLETPAEEVNYSFDERDRLKTVSDAANHSTTYFYDAANRPHSRLQL